MFKRMMTFPMILLDHTTGADHRFADACNGAAKGLGIKYGQDRTIAGDIAA